MLNENMDPRDYRPMAMAAQGDVSLPAVARLGFIMGLSRAKTLKALGMKANAGNRAWYDDVVSDLV